MAKERSAIAALVAKKQKQRAQLVEQIRQIDAELDGLEAAWRQCDALAAVRAAAAQN